MSSHPSHRLSSVPVHSEASRSQSRRTLSFTSQSRSELRTAESSSAAMRYVWRREISPAAPSCFWSGAFIALRSFPMPRRVNTTSLSRDSPCWPRAMQIGNAAAAKVTTEVAARLIRLAVGHHTLKIQQKRRMFTPRVRHQRRNFVPDADGRNADGPQKHWRLNQIQIHECAHTVIETRHPHEGHLAVFSAVMFLEFAPRTFAQFMNYPELRFHKVRTLPDLKNSSRNGHKPVASNVTQLDDHQDCAKQKCSGRDQRG